jgi:hypothetical protein
MKPKIKNIIVCLFISFFVLLTAKVLTTSTKGIEPEYKVIIVELGGVRNSESIDDQRKQYFPNLFNQMVKEGTLYTNLRDQNLLFHMGPAQAINTGVIHSYYHKEKSFPSIAQYIRGKYKLPKEKVWLFGHWHKDTMAYANNLLKQNTFPAIFSVQDFEAPEFLLKILSEQEKLFLTSLKAVKEKGLSYWTFWDSIEQMKLKLIKKIIKVYKPDFITYILGAPDAAHYGTFGRYVLSLKDSDEIIFELWKMIKSDTYYKGKTFFFVTPDHGRNKYYMNHNQDDEMRDTWLYVYGPGVAAGKKLSSPVFHVDIFPAIAEIMKLETHSCDGNTLEAIREAIPN